MKRLIPLFLILFFSAFANAQHCPFDGMAILVVQLVDQETGEEIQHARISVCDTAGNLVLNWDKKPLVFVRNPQKTEPDWDYYNFEKIRYSFAEDHFILPLPYGFKNQELYLKVESALGQFETKLIPLQAENYFALHNNIGDWTELYNRDESPEVPFDQLIRIEVKR